MLIQSGGKSFLAPLAISILTTAAANSGRGLLISTDLSWNAAAVQQTQSQDDDIKPGKSGFVFVSKKGGRTAPASSSVSRVKVKACNSDYCKQTGNRRVRFNRFVPHI